MFLDAAATDYGFALDLKDLELLFDMAMSDYRPLPCS